MPFPPKKMGPCPMRHVGAHIMGPPWVACVWHKNSVPVTRSTQKWTHVLHSHLLVSSTKGRGRRSNTAKLRNTTDTPNRDLQSRAGNASLVAKAESYKTTGKRHQKHGCAQPSSDPVNWAYIDEADASIPLSHLLTLFLFSWLSKVRRIYDYWADHIYLIAKLIWMTYIWLWFLYNL